MLTAYITGSKEVRAGDHGNTAGVSESPQVEEDEEHGEHFSGVANL